MPERHAQHVIAGMNGPMVYCAGCCTGRLWLPRLLVDELHHDGWRTIPYPFCGDLLAKHRAAKAAS